MIKQTLGVAVAAICCSSPALAQDWYEIELLIFEHNQNPYENSSDVESWPSDIDLAWPQPLLELDEASDQNTAEAPKPFQLIPFKQRRLSNANYAMRVRDQYELLWHRSWKAPLLGEQDSPWILVEAGEKIGDHYRLEGAIRVHLQRFLHLHTDLWLTDLQSENLEQQSDFHWSQLPRPTKNRWPCIFVQDEWPESERNQPSDSSASETWHFPFGCALDQTSWHDQQSLDELDISPALSITQSTSGKPETTTTEEKSAPIPIIDLSYPNSRSEAKRPGHEILAEIYRQELETDTNQSAAPAPLEYAFPVERITEIKAKRRMRSEELHYIDHPRVGILAVIHPIKQPKQQEKPVEYVPAPLPTSRVGN